MQLLSAKIIAKAGAGGGIIRLLVDASLLLLSATISNRLKKKVLMTRNQRLVKRE
jgi:hypothetical protein